MFRCCGPTLSRGLVLTLLLINFEITMTLSLLSKDNLITALYYLRLRNIKCSGNCYRPILSYLVFLFQKESSCKTFPLEMNWQVEDSIIWMVSRED